MFFFATVTRPHARWETGPPHDDEHTSEVDGARAHDDDDEQTHTIDQKWLFCYWSWFYFYYHEMCRARG